MKHHHDFEIILGEVLPTGIYRFTKACDCGRKVTCTSKTGDWSRL